MSTKGAMDHKREMRHTEIMSHVWRTFFLRCTAIHRESDGTPCLIKKNKIKKNLRKANTYYFKAICFLNQRIKNNFITI